MSIKAGRLELRAIKHNTLGAIVEIVAPFNTTAPAGDDVAFRITYSTVDELIDALVELRDERQDAIEESFCGAV